MLHMVTYSSHPTPTTAVLTTPPRTPPPPPRPPCPPPPHAPPPHPQLHSASDILPLIFGRYPKYLVTMTTAIITVICCIFSDGCTYLYRRTAVPPYRRTAVSPYRRTAVPLYRLSLHKLSVGLQPNLFRSPCFELYSFYFFPFRKKLYSYFLCVHSLLDSVLQLKASTLFNVHYTVNYLILNLS